MRRSRLAALLVTVSCLAACHSASPGSDGGAPIASASAALPSSSSAPPAPSAATATAIVAPLPREGGALVRSPRGDALYIADEDRSAIRRIALPLDESPPIVTPMPGRPAQVLAVGNLLLVTIRDPGLLLVMTPAADGTLAETARIVVPADAWGIAVSPDGKTAVVTSAWTHQVSVIDLDAKTVRYSLDVAREPRGVLVRDGKVAYVSHLVGAALTRIDLEGAGKATRVELPPSPLRTPIDARLDASFGFAMAMSPDGKRLFAARHALGAPGEAAWFGAPTVDVLMLANDKPLAPPRAGKPLGGTALEGVEIGDTWLDTPLPTMVQPRAMVYRQTTKTLLVASEGANTLFELNAVAIDPGVTPVSEQALGSAPDPTEPAPTRCGAPSGIALSVDEKLAYVWCRSTGDVALVELGTASEAKNLKVRHLADDTLSATAARGRRVFYDASDRITSGGLGCSGCHPDGRDDGHVWMEVQGPLTKAPIFVGGDSPMMDEKKPFDKFARQTPMLAGRVAAAGPYGWHAQNDDLEARVLEGARLHRWLNPPQPWERLQTAAKQRAAALADFLRTGLVPPPVSAHPLTPQEERGRAVFSSEETRCAGCHVPGTEYTNRVAVPIKQPGPTTQAAFSVETNDAFKTPSLLYVGGTAPYYHDGRAKTLEELIAGNEDRMGKTSQLSEEDRAALVAFLRTL
jgi:DNA-binding beta-propeller fold protein YncE/mono/diheme cytochrome c family protein